MIKLVKFHPTIPNEHGTHEKNETSPVGAYDTHPLTINVVIPRQAAKTFFSFFLTGFPAYLARSAALSMCVSTARPRDPDERPVTDTTSDMATMEENTGWRREGRSTKTSFKTHSKYPCIRIHVLYTSIYTYTLNVYRWVESGIQYTWKYIVHMNVLNSKWTYI